MLGVPEQITTGALTRRTTGGSAGCRNLHRGMKLASGGALLDVFGLRGLLVIGMESMAAMLRQLTGHNLHLSLTCSYPHFEWGWSQRLCSDDLTTACTSLSHPWLGLASLSPVYQPFSLHSHTTAHCTLLPVNNPHTCMHVHSMLLCCVFYFMLLLFCSALLGLGVAWRGWLHRTLVLLALLGAVACRRAEGDDGRRVVGALPGEMHHCSGRHGTPPSPLPSLSIPPLLPLPLAFWRNAALLGTTRYCHAPHHYQSLLVIPHALVHQ